MREGACGEGGGVPEAERKTVAVESGGRSVQRGGVWVDRDGMDKPQYDDTTDAQNNNSMHEYESNSHGCTSIAGTRCYCIPRKACELNCAPTLALFFSSLLFSPPGG